MTNATATKLPILKAAIDSRSLPIKLFGSGRSRHQRKLVYNYLATYANADGTNAYPSLTTIAAHCGLSRRGLIRIIQWLTDHGLLKKQDDRSPRNTNNYAVLFSSEDQERCRKALEHDGEEQKLSGKFAKAREGRVRGGKNAAAKRKLASDSEQSPSDTSSGDSQQSPCASDCTNHHPSDSRVGTTACGSATWWPIVFHKRD